MTKCDAGGREDPGSQGSEGGHQPQEWRWASAVQCSAVQCSAVQCSAVQIGNLKTFILGNELWIS